MKHLIALTLILLLACSGESPVSTTFVAYQHLDTLGPLPLVMTKAFELEVSAEINLADIGVNHICVMSPCYYCAAMRGRACRDTVTCPLPIRRFEQPINILPWGFGGPPNGLWD